MTSVKVSSSPYPSKVRKLLEKDNFQTEFLMLNRKRKEPKVEIPPTKKKLCDIE